MNSGRCFLYCIVFVFHLKIKWQALLVFVFVCVFVFLFVFNLDVKWVKCFFIRVCACICICISFECIVAGASLLLSDSGFPKEEFPTGKKINFITIALFCFLKLDFLKKACVFNWVNIGPTRHLILTHFASHVFSF